MYGREEAAIDDDLFLAVWGETRERKSDNALGVAMSRANAFLEGTPTWRRRLRRPRNRQVLHWE
jgi:hypothetical protein